jgi:hypothetical protein
MQFVCKPQDSAVVPPAAVALLQRKFMSLNNKKLYFYMIKIYCSPVFHRHFASPALQRHLMAPHASLERL